MKKLIITCAMTVSVCAPALAADAVAYEPAPAAPALAAPYDWSGFYAGATAGYGWGESDMRQGAPGPVPDTVDIDGFLLGGNVGYNHALNSRFAIGVEGDVAFSGIDGSFGPGFLPGGFGCGSGPCTTEIDWLATARGRAGLTFDRLFIFASGGVAAAGVESQIENTTDFQISETSVGWTVGGGAEYAFSDRWSAKLEYLHVDLGDTDAAANGFFTTNELDIVRGGINFHF